MSDIDFVLISQSETVRYEDYNGISLERIDLYRNLVQLRMVYFDGGFRSHLDLLNKVFYGKYFYEAAYPERRNLLNMWNLPGLNGFLSVDFLIKEKFNCKIITNFDSEFDVLLRYCNQMNPRIIGISTTFILQWSEIGRITKKIHESIPGAVIVLGGAFVNNQYLIKDAGHFERPMRKYGIKYVIYSFNSEVDLLPLVKSVKKAECNVKGVNNLAYIGHDNIYNTTNTVWNNSIVNTIIPFKDIVDTNMGTKTLQIRTASGCPFNCAFCSYPVTSKDYRLASIENIRKQLEEIKRLNEIEAVVFIDDTINVPPKRFREIVTLLKDYNFRWYAFYRVQYADEKIAQDLKESGCDGLYLGLESANDNVLQNMNKKTSVYDYRRGIEALKKYNIPLFAAFVIGFPGETVDSVNDNIAFIEQTGLDFYSVKEFFYLHTAPVHSMRSDFQLDGEGYKWNHSTMTSIQASEMKLKIFESVKNSIHIDPDLGLWYLIYLRDRGFTWDGIRDVQNVINNMAGLDNAGLYGDKEPLFNELKNKVKKWKPKT